VKITVAQFKALTKNTKTSRKVDEFSFLRYNGLFLSPEEVFGMFFRNAGWISNGLCDIVF
jgi:hypothetical protein